MRIQTTSNLICKVFFWFMKNHEKMELERTWLQALTTPILQFGQAIISMFPFLFLHFIKSKQGKSSRERISIFGASKSFVWLQRN